MNDTHDCKTKLPSRSSSSSGVDLSFSSVGSDPQSLDAPDHSAFDERFGDDGNRTWSDDPTAPLQPFAHLWFPPRSPTTSADSTPLSLVPRSPAAFDRLLLEAFRFDSEEPNGDACSHESGTELAASPFRRNQQPISSLSHRPTTAAGGSNAVSLEPRVQNRTRSPPLPNTPPLKKQRLHPFAHRWFPPRSPMTSADATPFLAPRSPAAFDRLLLEAFHALEDDYGSNGQGFRAPEAETVCQFDSEEPKGNASSHESGTGLLASDLQRPLSALPHHPTGGSSTVSPDPRARNRTGLSPLPITPPLKKRRLVSAHRSPEKDPPQEQQHHQPRRPTWTVPWKKPGHPSGTVVASNHHRCPNRCPPARLPQPAPYISRDRGTHHRCHAAAHRARNTASGGFPLPSLAHHEGANKKVQATKSSRTKPKNTKTNVTGGDASACSGCVRAPSLESFGRKWKWLAKRKAHFSEHRMSEPEQRRLLCECFGRAITRRSDDSPMASKYKCNGNR